MKLSELLADGLFVDGDWVETKDQSVDGDVRLTQLADVGEGVWRNRSDRRLTSETAARLRCTYLRPADVLVARMPDPLGRACVFPGDPRPSITVVDVCILRPPANRVNPKWLMFTLNAPSMRRSVASLQSGTTRKRISRKNLGSIPIPVPPVPDQERISQVIEDQFSRLDAAEASLRRTEHRLKDLALRFVEASLDCSSSHKLGDILSNMSYGTSTKCSYDSEGMPVLRIPNIRDRSIDLSDLKFAAETADLKSCIVGPNDLLFIRTNGSKHLIGKAAAVGDNSGLAFASYLIRGTVDVEVAEPAYLALVLATPRIRALIESKAASTAGQYNLNLGAIRSVEVPVPSLSVQRRMIDAADRVISGHDAVGQSVEVSLRRSQQLRRVILELAFTGKLVLHQAPDELALRLVRAP